MSFHFYYFYTFLIKASGGVRAQQPALTGGLG